MSPELEAEPAPETVERVSKIIKESSDECPKCGWSWSIFPHNNPATRWFVEQTLLALTDDDIRQLARARGVTRAELTDHVAEERERCAELAAAAIIGVDTPAIIAAAIRARAL